MVELSLSDTEFKRLQEYIHSLCGIYVQEAKKYLILQRLEDLVREYGYDTFSEFTTCLLHEPPVELREKLISAITTNETSFFRDTHPFIAFEQELLPVLGERIKRQKKEAREGEPRPKIWIMCAGASTRQEPYSLAMIISDYLEKHCFLGVEKKDFRILATDISERVLARARQGEFHAVDITRGLGPERLEKHFEQDGQLWRIKDCLRDMVEFRKMNLVEPMHLFACFDIIFCRNVLIYFDDATKKTIVDQFARKLNSGGHLVLGSAENLYNLGVRFKSVQIGETIVYQKIE